MRTRLRAVGCLLSAILASGCATSRGELGGLVTSGNSSAGSGASSGDSSGNSANSSGQSADSSGQSNDSSRGSSATSQSTNNSSGQGGSSDSGRSSNQSSQNSSANSGQSSAVVSGVSLLAVTSVGIGFAIYGTVMALQPRSAPPAVAVRYLRANEPQLRQDLALGAGPTLDDLASAAEVRIENGRRFRKLLQSHRKELLDLSHPAALTADRALRFFSRIGELAWSDERLRQDARAFAERHRDAG